MKIAARPRRSNSILLTSLVDVMFVLLFFFMLASSYLDWRQLSLGLAEDPSRASPMAAAPSWRFTLMPGARYALNGETLPLAEIAARLKANPHRLVVLPGPNVSLQELVAALDVLRPTGAEIVLGKP